MVCSVVLCAVVYLGVGCGVAVTQGWIMLRVMWLWFTHLGGSVKVCGAR